MYTNSMNTKRSDKSLTAMAYILKALVPYTEQNLLLAFHPSKFLSDLERTSGYSRQTLKQTYLRAKKQRMISLDTTPRLTAKGRQYVQPFIAKKLAGGGNLMVIFDIPQDFSDQRRQFRNLLRHLEFAQTQRSVWMSPNDHVDCIREAVRDLHLGDWVQLYEASKIE